MQVGGGIDLTRPIRVAGDAGALLDADFERGRFSAAGKSFATESELRTAIGGTVASSGHLFIGPYAAPDATELVPGGDFSGGVGGWLTNGDPLAVVDGALQATGNGGNTTNAYLPIHTLVSPGRAYRLQGQVRRGTANSVHLGFGAPVSTHNYAGSNSITSTSMTGVQLYCGGLHPSSVVIALRHIVNPSSGTYYADDISLKEVTPLPGFVSGAFCGRIEATTPASGGTERIVLQADDNAIYENTAVERNFIRLVWDTNGHIRFIVSSGATGSQVEQANLDLGTVAPATRFTVVFSARLNDFKAALVGQPTRSDTSGSFPGLAVIRLGRGRSNTDRLWTGTIDRLQLWPRAMSDAQFLAAAGQDGIAVWGDSLTVGTGASDAAHSYPSVAETLFDPPRGISRQGSGGQTSTQIAARMNALPILVTVADNLLPASGGVSVTAKSINILWNSVSFSGSQSGWLAGVNGVMSTDSSGNWTFTRETSGATVAVPPGTAFVCELGEALRPRTHWLWLGRNGAQSGHTVLGDIAAAVASLGHNRYLVGSLLVPTAPGSSTTVNAQLAATYGPRFVNVLQMLIDANDGSPTDLDDVADGYVPSSLRSDASHLNDDGYAIVAEGFHAAHVAMGWN